MKHVQASIDNVAIPPLHEPRDFYQHIFCKKLRVKFTFPTSTAIVITYKKIITPSV